MASQSTASPAATSEILQTILERLERFSRLEETVARLTERVDEVRPLLNSSTRSAPAEPVEIPRPPTTAQINRSTATCKPPKEPSLTGDKQQEWMDFEREFLRYFRITQGYYMEPEVQVDLLLATAGEKV